MSPPESSFLTGTNGTAEAQHDTNNEASNSPVTTPIEADSLRGSGEDSDFGDSGSTQSLTNDVFELQKENGRTYHGYRAGKYPFPNDASEQDRLDFQYWAVAAAMNEKLHLAPLDDPKYILDIGTGTGLWAIDMGEKYPNSQVEATDLSVIQPSAVPSNVQFIIDDAEQEDWGIPPSKYDFIHTRIMLGCFRDFRHIISQSYHHLKPGGWLESQEVLNRPYCDDNTMPKNWIIHEWTEELNDAAEEAGRPLRIAAKLRGWFEDAGFVDVQEKIIKLPLNSWPKDPHMKNLGLWWGENVLLGAQGFSLAYASRYLGWSKDEIEVYLIDVRNALKEQPPRVHAYYKLFIVWGRKPFPGEAIERDESKNRRS